MLVMSGGNIHLPRVETLVENGINIIETWPWRFVLKGADFDFHRAMVRQVDWLHGTKHSIFKDGLYGCCHG